MIQLDRRRRLIGSLAGFIVLAMTVGGVYAASGARHASATIIDATGATIGWARLVEDASGDGTGVVHVSVHVKGLAPGLHGIHIHSNGACTPTFAAAGPHYNPVPHEHGLENPNGPHAGDLPNLVVNGDGVGRLNTTTDRVTISASGTTLFDSTLLAVGSALIIHANPDNQITNTNPDNGGSGARIACGVIVAN